MAPDKLPLYGEMNRIHMLDGLRSRGFVVPNSDYPASTNQNLQDNPNTLRGASGADMNVSMHPPIVPPRAPPRSGTNPYPQEQEPLRTGNSRLSYSQFAQLFRQHQETIQTPALRLNTRSTSNPIPPQSPQLPPEQQQHVIQKVTSWLDSTNNSLAMPGHDPQSSQQNRQPEESLIRGLQDLQLTGPTRDRSRMNPGERIELFIKFFLRDGPEDFEKTFERSLGEAISEELKVIIDDKMKELHPQQLGHALSQNPERMDRQLSDRFAKHRPTELHVGSNRGFAIQPKKPHSKSMPLQPEEMNETGGIVIRGVPRASSVGGPTLEFSVTLSVRPEETCRMEQGWQDFFSFGHVQAVRELLQVHTLRCDEEYFERVKQASARNEEPENGAGIGVEQGSEEAKESQGDGCSGLGDMEEMGDTEEMDDMQDMEKTWRGWEPWKT